MSVLMAGTPLVAVIVGKKMAVSGNRDTNLEKRCCNARGNIIAILLYYYTYIHTDNDYY